MAGALNSDMVCGRKPTSEQMLKVMDDYLDNFKKMSKENPEAAKEKAVESLIRMGAFTKSGKPKKRIVTWE